MTAKPNVIENLYPSTKFYLVLFFAVTVFIVPSYWYAYAVLPVCMILAYFAGCFKEFSNLALKALLLIVVFIFILQSFFYPGTDILWSLGIFSIKREGILFSLALTSKIVAIASAFILFFRTTKVKDIAYALEQVGAPPKATFVILATLQIIPEMKKLSYVIMDAQRTRGVETEGKLSVRIKAFLPTLSPLILGSIANTEERVLTLESRAFTANVRKTSLYSIAKTSADRFVLILLAALLILMIVGRILL